MKSQIIVKNNKKYYITGIYKYSTFILPKKYYYGAYIYEQGNKAKTFHRIGYKANNIKDFLKIVKKNIK